MTFVIVVYVPGAIVLASDSRQFVTFTQKTEEEGEVKEIRTRVPSSDSVYKTFLVKEKFGISTYGAALLGKIHTSVHIQRFEETLEEDLKIEQVSKKLVEFFRKKFPEANTGFYVAGYDIEEGHKVPHIYHCHIAKNSIARVNLVKNKVVYGSSMGGETDTMSRFLKSRSAPPITFDAMTEQDAVDFARYSVEMTINTMRFQVRNKTVGGPIDILLITPDGTNWIARKMTRV